MKKLQLLQHKVGKRKTYSTRDAHALQVCKSIIIRILNVTLLVMAYKQSILREVQHDVLLDLEHVLF